VGEVEFTPKIKPRRVLRSTDDGCNDTTEVFDVNMEGHANASLVLTKKIVSKPSLLHVSPDHGATDNDIPRNQARKRCIASHDNVAESPKVLDTAGCGGYINRNADETHSKAGKNERGSHLQLV
jgi:hypothetical protein